MPTVVASAPGKVMVAGEYAVLSGASALVMAVDARATATLHVASADAQGDSPSRTDRSPAASTLPPEVLLTQREAERVLGRAPMELTIDTSALRDGDQKLGLGSSAAGAVAAAAAVFASAGIDPARARDRVFAAAFAGHRAVAPHGSGADVASAAHGGLIRYRRDGDAITVDRRTMPRSVRACLVWTGAPVRTSELVDRVRAFEERDRHHHADLIATLSRWATTLTDAIAADDRLAIVLATRGHHDAMRALGEAAGAPIVTPALAWLAEVAARFGGASKPSGAGGGDVAIAFLPLDTDEASLRAELGRRDLRVLDLALGVDGARSETAPRTN